MRNTIYALCGSLRAQLPDQMVSLSRRVSGLSGEADEPILAQERHPWPDFRVSQERASEACTICDEPLMRSCALTDIMRPPPPDSKGILTGFLFNGDKRLPAALD